MKFWCRYWQLSEIAELYKYLRAVKAAPDITFYSESATYYRYMRSTIKSLLERSNLKILYLTSDKNDELLNKTSSRFQVFYINKLLPFLMPFIKTKTLIMTMPDLNQFHIRRSSNPVNHIYMFHAVNSTHMTYNLGAFDFYDTIFCVGPHHIKEIRKTEEIYSLPEKQLVEVGYPLLENLERTYKNLPLKNREKPCILVAPSWNEDNILDSCIDDILKSLLQGEYKIIVRPHPEYIKRYPDRVLKLEQRYEEFTQVMIETEMTSDESIYKSDLLITDWSGISIEYAWGLKKSVIFFDTPQKVHNPEYEKLGLVPLEVRLRDKIGVRVQIEDASNLGAVIEKLLSNSDEWANRMEQLRNENIFNWGTSSQVAADYIIQYCNEVQ